MSHNYYLSILKQLNDKAFNKIVFFNYYMIMTPTPNMTLCDNLSRLSFSKG